MAAENEKTILKSAGIKIIGIGLILALIFVCSSSYFAYQFMEKTKKQRLLHLKETVQIARNSIKPILVEYCNQTISQENALEQIRDLIRRMAYNDSQGKNYIFMSTYDGIALVKPFVFLVILFFLVWVSVKEIHLHNMMLRKAEEALRKSDERYKEIIEGTDNLVTEVDTEGRFTFVNEAARKVFGLSPEACIGRLAFDFIHSQDKEKTLSNFDRWVKEKKPIVSFENRQVSQSGQVRDMLWTINFYFNGQGGITSIRSIARDITERKQMEQKLIESEQRLREAHKLARMGFWLWDIETGEVEWSDEMFRLFGLDPETFTPQIDSILKLSPWPEDHQRDKELLQRAMESHEPGQYEQRFLRSDGSIGYYLSTFQGIYDENTRLIAMRGTAQDITERKQMLEALRESEQFLTGIFHTVPTGISIFKDRQFVTVNDRFCEIIGYTQDELIGKSTRMLYVSEDEYQRCGKEIYSQVKKHGRCSVEAHMVRKNGQNIHALINASRLSPEDGDKDIITSILDITDRKRAEVALEKRILALTQPMVSTEDVLFEELFNFDDIQRLQDEFAQAAGVASIITRTDGTPITEPSNFCRLCRDIIRKTDIGRINCYASDAAIGRNNPEGPIIQPCLSGGLCDAGASISVGGKHIANWLIGQVRDGTQTDEQMRVYARKIGADEKDFIKAFHEVPVMSREQFGHVAQALFTITGQLSATAYQNIQQARFISERKRAGKELSRYRNHLEELVEERTEELKLANERLQVEISERSRAESESRRYAETQEVLVREVNHRVKNNLSAIISMLHMEEDRAEEKDMELFCTALHDLVSRIEGLATVHNLLSASGWRPLEVRELCTQVILAAFKGIPLGKRIHTNISSNSVKVGSTKAHHLTLVINELATNAMKYALNDRGEASFTVDFQQRDDALEMVFRDDGPGYPEHILQEHHALSSIGFELIRGITRRSLEGEIVFSNDSGAVAQLSFRNEIIIK